MSGSPHKDEGVVRHHDEPQQDHPQPHLVLDNIAEQHGFDWAITRLKMGNRVARRGWNGKGMWLNLVVPHDTRYLPYIQMITVQGQLVPWLASQTDMLADDWVWG